MENRQDVYRDPELDLGKLKEEAAAAARELIETAGLREGQIFVVGCSTSEICGERIGSDSSIEAAKAVFSGIYEELNKRWIYLAAQCCEHLNRAIVTERAAVPDCDIVSVVPQPKAGGSFATAAFYSFNDPVVVEEIRADAGIDIGGTLIGMHLKRVAVPVRLINDTIGSAHIIAARTRPRYIGGIRAAYEADGKIAENIRRNNT